MERCSKSQEGGIYVDVGEIRRPPSTAFFYYRGEAGAPTITASIIASMEGIRVVVGKNQ